MRSNEAFCDYVADRLAGLPGVRAVTLGGSRAAGTIATAACQAAHAVLAAAGQWVINEKTLLDRVDLRSMDEILTGLTPGANQLAQAVDRVEALLQAAVTRACADGRQP